MSGLFFSQLSGLATYVPPPPRVAPELRARLSEASYLKKLKAAKRYLWLRGVKPWTNWKDSTPG